MSKTYKHLVWDGNADTQAQSAVEDGAGKNIENTYAKQDGYYAEMSVGLADNLISATLVKQDSAYIFRPTANNVSIESGKAELNYIKGYVIEPIHQSAVFNVEPSIYDLIDVNEEQFKTALPNSGIYTFTVTAVNQATLIGQIITCDLSGTDGTQISGISGGLFTGDLYNVYGINIHYYDEGTPYTVGDTITITSTGESIGTFTTINPTQFKAVGFNAYNNTAGAAKLLGGYQYRIVGTYTSVSYLELDGTTAETITIDENGFFTPENDGILTVVGGNATDTMVYMPWTYGSETFDYEAYSESTITIPTEDKDGNKLRNDSTVLGYIPAVIKNGEVIAQDIINLQEKKYIANVEYISYSAANLATVQALPNVKYIYDENTIIYVSDNTKPQVIELANTVTNSYIANDFGTEEFVGIAYNSTIGVPCQNEYGDNLKDRLRSDVLTISAQELTTEQQTQVKQNLGLEITTGVDAFRDLY